MNVLINELVRARDAIDQVEVKGHTNRSLLVYAYNACNNVLKQLGKVYEVERKALLNKEEISNDDSDSFA